MNDLRETKTIIRPTRLFEALGIPTGYTAQGTFVIGHPAETFLRVPARKPIDVTWH